MEFSRLATLLAILASCQSNSNVLMVVVDDLRPALGCYGDKTAYTPNIDALADKSFVFTNAHAQLALCAPSRNSFLTSRRPDSLRLYDFYSYWRNFSGNFTTLPQFFKENGYYTKSVGKVFHPGKSSNFSDDFPYSWSEKPYHAPTEIYENAKVCVEKDGTLQNNLVCPVKVEYQPMGRLPDQEILMEAKNFLENKDRVTEKPFFLAVGFHKPHIPFRFPEKYLDYHPLELVQLPTNRYRSATQPTVSWNPWNDIRHRNDIKNLNIPFPYGPIPDETIKKIKQSYYASVSYIDELIGQLITSVDNNTIILIFGDHGWSISEHGEFAKYSNYDVATKIPLIVHIPQENVFGGVKIPQLVELVDIFPTLTDLALSKNIGECKKSYFEKLCAEGRSFANLLSHTNSSIYIEKSAVFSQYPRPAVLPTLHPNSDEPKLDEIHIMGYSMRTKRYRYTEWVDFNATSFTANFSRVFGRELYDFVIDPEENLNLAERSFMADVVFKLHAKLILNWRYA